MGERGREAPLLIPGLRVLVAKSGRPRWAYTRRVETVAECQSPCPSPFKKKKKTLKGPFLGPFGRLSLVPQPVVCRSLHDHLAHLQSDNEIVRKTLGYSQPIVPYSWHHKELLCLVTCLLSLLLAKSTPAVRRILRALDLQKTPWKSYQMVKATYRGL